MIKYKRTSNGVTEELECDSMGQLSMFLYKDTKGKARAKGTKANEGFKVIIKDAVSVERTNDELVRVELASGAIMSFHESELTIEQ